MNPLVSKSVIIEQMSAAQGHLVTHDPLPEDSEEVYSMRR